MCLASTNAVSTLAEKCWRSLQEETTLAGYWLNPTTHHASKSPLPTTTGCEIVQNVASIGLPESAYEEVMRFSPTQEDQIRLVAIRSGLVRIREHPRYVSVQYAAESDQEKPVLQAVFTALKNLKMSAETTLVIDNLLLRTSIRIGLNELEAQIKD